MANRKPSFSFRSLFSATRRPPPTAQSKTEEQAPSTKTHSTPTKLKSQPSPRPRPVSSTPSRTPKKASIRETEAPISTAPASKSKLGVKSDSAKSFSDAQTKVSTSSALDNKSPPSSSSRATKKASTREIEAPTSTTQASQPKTEDKLNNAKSFNDTQMMASTSSKSDNNKPTPSSPSRPPKRGSTQEIEDPMQTAQASQPKEEVKPYGAKSSDDAQIIASTTSKNDNNPVPSSPSQTPNRASTQEIEAPTPVAQASQTKEEIKSDGAKGSNDAQMKVSTLSELDNKPTPSPKEPEEIKEVKEVVNEPSNKPNPETNKEMDKPPVPSPKPRTVEETDVSKPNKAQMLQQEANAISANITQPKKQSRFGATCEKSIRPGGRRHVPLQKDIKNDVSAFVNRMSTESLKSSIHDGPVSVITLTGENRGASMQMGGSNSSNGEHSVYIHRGYKNKLDQSVEATSDGDGRTERMNSEDQPEAYVNNNAQGVNNSIVFNSSISERNPGVHMAARHGLQEAIQSETIPTTQKTVFNVARAERLTNESTVRRRCLRGLLLEWSDSNEGNPERPRRHGCQVSSSAKQFARLGRT